MTRKVPTAAAIIACGLIFAARPTTSTLIPKNAITSPTPSAAPSSPLVPPKIALNTIMSSATGAVSMAERRRITA